MTTTTDDIADVMALDGGALRSAVYVEVMGNPSYRPFHLEDRWRYEATLPPYDTDHNAAAEVIEAINERGPSCRDAFCEALLRILILTTASDTEESLWWEDGDDSVPVTDVFFIATASPADKCRAALLAVRAAKERTEG